MTIDDSNGYPQWKIKFDMEESINLQRRRPISDDRVRQQSINSHHHASTASSIPENMEKIQQETGEK